MTTAQKLRALAKVILRNRRFNIMSVNHCILAVGNRYDPETDTFNRRSKLAVAGNKDAFQAKYGTTREHTRLLWVGFLATVPDDEYEEVVKDSHSTKQAAELLERLAQRYE